MLRASRCNNSQHCWTLVCKRMQQLPTTRNNMQQGVQTGQHLAPTNVGSCWLETMLHQFAWGFTFT